MPQTFALLLFPWPVSSLSGVSMMRWHTEMRVPSESLRWATLRGIRRCFKKTNWPSTRDFDTYCISNVSLCISCVRDTAAKWGFLAIISHNVSFSNDIVLKWEGIISHKHYLMQTFAVALFPWPVLSLAGVFIFCWQTRMRTLIQVIKISAFSEQHCVR